ncbi:MAG TPA: transposase, partial [Terrimicrobium sp.]
MSKRKRQSRRRAKAARSAGKSTAALDPQVNSDAAGIDVGANTHWVAVPEDRDENAVRSFGVFTSDLKALCDWLKGCQVETVAMESTGVYWIPLFQMLEKNGFEVRLVNASHA